MKRIIVLLIAIVFFVGACATHVHTVGDGPQNGSSSEDRQWYVLWGLVPINDVDSAEMARDAEDYEIKTEQDILDIAISVFLGWTSIHARTVTVTE